MNPVVLRVAREGTTAHRFRRTQRSSDVAAEPECSTVYDLLDPSQMIWAGEVVLAYGMRLRNAMGKRGLIELELHGSLVEVGKYETGLLPSGSGVAGKIGEG